VLHLFSENGPGFGWTSPGICKSMWISYREALRRNKVLKDWNVNFKLLGKLKDNAHLRRNLQYESRLAAIERYFLCEVIRDRAEVVFQDKYNTSKRKNVNLKGNHIANKRSNTEQWGARDGYDRFKEYLPIVKWAK